MQARHELATSDHVGFLRNISLFEDIRDLEGALDRLSEAMTLRTYAPGAAIINEGETGSEMFFLMEGDAAVFKTTAEGEPYKVAILRGSQHAFFGEGGLLDSEARSATIRAESPCRCLVLERAAFMSYGEAYPMWALPILSRIARAVMLRLRKTNDDLMLLYNALVAEIRGH